MTPDLRTNVTWLQALKAEIAGTPEVAGKFAEEIAKYYNALASPNYVVWKRLVTLTEMGQLINKNDLGNITTANLDRVRSFYTVSPNGTSPERTDDRAFWDNTFSGAAGATTRAAYGAVGGFKRYATRAEKLFSTGAGTEGTPSVMGPEGTISYQEVEAAQAS